MRPAALLAMLLCACAGDAPRFEANALDVVTRPEPNPFDGPCLQLPPVSLPPAVAGCGSSSQTVPLKNTCPFPVGLSAPKAGGAFGVTRLPLRLVAGETADLEVRHAPTAPGAASATLVLRVSSGASFQDLALEVRGSGTSPRTAAYDITLPIRRLRQSLLLVVDDDLPEARARFTTVARVLRVTERFRRVAFVDLTGTLSRPSGRSELDPADPDFERLFLEGALPPPRDGRRSCLDAIEAARASGELPGFFDDDTFAGAVCLTNELDQADRPMSEELRRWERRVALTSASFGYLGPFGNCPGTVDWRLDALVTATAGVRESLCQARWDTAITEAGRFGGGFVVPLPATPSMQNPATLRVRLRGVQVPSSPDTWQYESAAHALRLGFAANEPGLPIEIRWETCDP